MRLLLHSHYYPPIYSPYRILKHQYFQMGSSPSTQTHLNKYNHNQSLPKKRPFRIEQLQMSQQDLNLIHEIAKSHCLLSILTDQQINECKYHFTKWVYSCGRYIYRQHDIAQEIYLISQGNVSVQIDCCIVKSLGEREYFGHDATCFGCQRSESIRVISSQATLFSIRKQKLMPVIQKRMQDYKQDINSMFNRIHFFNYLTNKERRFLINSTQLFKLNPNQVLFEKEQDANSFYVVKKNTIIVKIHNKKDIVMKEGDYFGESAFLQLLNASNKSQRMGKAVANQHGAQVYAIGLSPVKVCLGYYIRSIIFFNQQKWALFRNEYINILPNVDYNYLLQLFNVRQGKKFSVLAKKGSKPKYIFIPLQVQINKSRELIIYGSQLIGKNKEDQVINYDVILTDNGYYAYALIDEVRQVLYLNKSSQHKNEIQIKLLKQPLYMSLTLTLRNLSKFSKRLVSSDYSTVLIVQDMKFGNQFIVKIYKRKIQSSCISNNCITAMAQSSRSLHSYKVISCSNDLNVQRCSKTSIKPYYQKVQKGKLVLDQHIIRREKNIIASLCSNYVCGYYKAQKDQNNYYLFFQYIIGRKLQDIMRIFGKIPYKVTKYFLASLANALHYLHSNHVIYRNLNPNDIIIKSNGKLILIDFSCSKKLDQTHRTSTLIGTPFYIAPQTIKEEAYTYNADIWSMGVIFYQMITGMVPFGHNQTDPMKIYECILNKEVNLKIIQQKKEKVLLSALLEKDASKRVKNSLEIRNFQYINDLQFSWKQFLNDSLSPSYFPPSAKIAFTNINNYQLFDGSLVVDWN